MSNPPKRSLKSSLKSKASSSSSNANKKLSSSSSSSKSSQLIYQTASTALNLERIVFSLQSVFVSETSPSFRSFELAFSLFRPCDFDAILEERSACSPSVCGWPMCIQKKNQNEYKETKKFAILLKERKVVDVRTDIFYCSDACLSATQYFRCSLSDEPLAMRTEVTRKLFGVKGTQKENLKERKEENNKTSEEELQRRKLLELALQWKSPAQSLPSHLPETKQNIEKSNESKSLEKQLAIPSHKSSTSPADTLNAKETPEDLSLPEISEHLPESETPPTAVKIVYMKDVMAQVKARMKAEEQQKNMTEETTSLPLEAKEREQNVEKCSPKPEAKKAVTFAPLHDSKTAIAATAIASLSSLSDSAVHDSSVSSGVEIRGGGGRVKRKVPKSTASNSDALKSHALTNSAAGESKDASSLAPLDSSAKPVILSGLETALTFLQESANAKIEERQAARIALHNESKEEKESKQQHELEEKEEEDEDEDDTDDDEENDLIPQKINHELVERYFASLSPFASVLSTFTSLITPLTHSYLHSALHSSDISIQKSSTIDVHLSEQRQRSLLGMILEVLPGVYSELGISVRMDAQIHQLISTFDFHSAIPSFQLVQKQLLAFALIYLLQLRSNGQKNKFSSIILEGTQWKWTQKQPEQSEDETERNVQNFLNKIGFERNHILSFVQAVNQTAQDK